MRHNKQVSDLREPQKMLFYASRRLDNYCASRHYLSAVALAEVEPLANVPI